MSKVTVTLTFELLTPKSVGIVYQGTYMYRFCIPKFHDFSMIPPSFPWYNRNTCIQNTKAVQFSCSFLLTKWSFYNFFQCHCKIFSDTIYRNIDSLFSPHGFFFAIELSGNILFKSLSESANLYGWCVVINFNVHSISDLVTSALHTNASMDPLLVFCLGNCSCWVGFGIDMFDPTVASMNFTFDSTGLKNDFYALHAFEYSSLVICFTCFPLFMCDLMAL